MIKTVSLLCYSKYDVLAAKGKTNTWNKYSGIGGKVERREDPINAILREFFEEVFNLNRRDVPRRLWNFCLSFFTIMKVSPSFPSHLIFFLPFPDLEAILSECKIAGLTSPLYDVFPTRIRALIRNRKYADITSELGQFKQSTQTSVIQQSRLYTKEFISDVQTLRSQILLV